MHLSQPAFSRSIQLLESQVGMKLFDRETGQVKPTPAGLFLADRARRLLFDARSLQRDTQLFKDSALGDTAFGVGPLPAATIMPRVLPELRRQYPAVSLRIETSNWQLLHERLLAEDIEFFVADVQDLPVDERLTVLPVGGQVGALFARAGHPLAGGPCSMAEAWRHGVASSKWPMPVKERIGGLVGLPPAAPVLAVECDDLSVLRKLVAGSDTLLAASEASCSDDLAAGTLVQLQVRDLPRVQTEMAIVVLANRTPSPMAQRAMGCVQQVAHEVNAALPAAH